MFRPTIWCGILAIVASGCSDSQSASDQVESEQPDSATRTTINSEDLTAGAPSLMSGVDVDRLKDKLRGPSPTEGAAGLQFTDVAAAMGVSFAYDNGDSPERLMTQATGGGVAWFDYDCDRFPDLFLTQGGSPLSTDRPVNPVDRLFRNRSGFRFDDVTAPAGILEPGFSQGVAVGDFDNDGFDDVYVTNVGLDAFFRNCGDGTFQDETDSTQLLNPAWGTSAAWGDLDEDGDLDLFVCNYVKYDPHRPIACYRSDGSPGICHPDHVEPAANQLFVNQGDGTFRGILESAGLDQPGSKSLALAIADLNGDQLVDVYVANDTTANHLFINEGNLRFRETGVLSGCAASGEGHFQASMGVGLSDYDRDGHPDLYVTHFTSDSNTLYRGLGNGMFSDMTRETGLHVPTLPMLAFGTIMADFDCNGRDEIFVANGHIDDSYQRLGDRYKMPAQLFAWSGSIWMDQSDQAGPYFQREVLGRGAAYADFDQDGDLDLAISHQREAAAVLRNDREGGHWLKLRFMGRTSNRRGIGAQVRLTQEDRILIAQLPGGTSYCASHEPLVFMGFGDSDANVAIEVIWPSGWISRVPSAAVDQELIVREGGKGE